MNEVKFTQIALRDIYKQQPIARLTIMELA